MSNGALAATLSAPFPPLMSRLLVLALVLAGCQSSTSPRLETAADSLAFRVSEGAGGLKAWEALPALAFDWAVVNDSVEVVRVHHLWDRAGDRSRVEWPGGTDSVLVAVFSPSQFDPDAPEGRVALNGTDLEGAERAERLVEANRRFVNDGYWLLAPLKTLDPGVRRDLDPNGRDLALSFDNVGLTPGDRYWIEVDPVTHSMTGWRYQLEGDTAVTRWAWLDPIDLPTDRGPVRLATMKVRDGGGRAILTEPVAVENLDETMFTDLTPRGWAVDPASR